MNPLKRVAVGLVVAALALTGCAVEKPRVINPADKVTRPLTVGTFGRVSTTDPAAATDTGSTVYALNVFQRLMTVQVGSAALKPDAATDCMFIDELTYTCGIRRNLSFTNGNDLTASDVKFSIERARALAVPGSSSRLLDLIDDMIIPEDNPLRIDFKLKQHDRTFGYALASPAASIVDEDSYKLDELWPQWQQPVSSGPFFADVATLDELRLIRYPRYGGANGARSLAVALKMYSTPEALDRAIATRTVDVLWRVPASQVPADGTYAPQTMEGAVVQRLLWNPNSPKRQDAALRAWVREGTNPLRTLAAAVPPDVNFSEPTFETGGARPTSAVTGEITLGFDLRLPGQEELAGQIRDALQPDVTVQLVGDEADADVWLSNGQPWTNTTMAWLQPYVEFPLPDRQAEVRRLELAFREADGLPEAQRTAAELQRLMEVDATVVPLSQGDEIFWMAPDVELDQESKNWMGPSWQLGVWGFERVEK